VRLPKTLRARLFAAIAAIVVVSIGATLVAGAVLTRRAVERATARDLAHQADLVAGRERASIAPLAHLASLRTYLARQGERVVTVPLDGSSAFLAAKQLAALRAGKGVQGSLRIGGHRDLYAARPVGERALVLLKPARLSGTTWRPFLNALVIAGAIGGALAALVSIFLARGIARPVRRVAAATRSLAASGSAAPIAVEGPEELASLARSFNDLAQQLARARDAERSFLLSVSHELKTPLTAIRGYAEAVTDGAIGPVEASEVIAVEAARLERLVRDLLDLARLNKSEFGIEASPVDLGEAAGEVVRRYAAQARTFGVALEAEVDAPARALADPDRVVQVVSNLLENALRLTPSGGRVRVIAAGSTVTVDDTGPGLKPEELPRAFERFFLHSRYGREREVGTGLGLAIVKELAQAMGGSVYVESRPGGPTAFVVRLPKAPPAADEAQAQAPALERVTR
jgi:two-component system OmpR family sensor kinase